MASMGIICIPSSDGTFRAAVDHALASDPTITKPADLEEALRGRYEHVKVRPRELSGEQHPVWYVYRNGGFAHAP